MGLVDVKAKVGQHKILREEQLPGIVLGPVVALDIETYGDGKNPGDCFKVEGHGIAGVSFCDGGGEAYYAPMAYKGHIDGASPFSFCKKFSVLLEKCGVKTIITHYGKFDYGFLWSQGLVIPSNCQLVDTWILNSLSSVIGGEFSSNKLKELARRVLGIATSTEEAKDKAMQELDTKDYGELNADILAPYACDDVRYTYLLAGELCAKASASARAVHDKIIKAWWNLIAAEDAGMPLAPDFDAKMEFISKQTNTWWQRVMGSFSGTSLIVSDDAAMLAHFASKNMHPPAWGDAKEIRFDREYATAVAQKDETMRNYLFYRLYREMERPFLSARNRAGWFFPSFLASVYSKTGLVYCKTPDLDNIVFNACFRSLFAPPKGTYFLHVRIPNLYLWLLDKCCLSSGSTISQSAETRIASLVKKAGCSYEEAQVCLRRTIEGFGFQVFKVKLSLLKTRQTRDDYALWDRFKEALGKQDFGTDEDYLGRILNIHPDKNYRRGSIILQSSYGHVLCEAMNFLCQRMQECGAMVFAHGQDFLFHVTSNIEKAVACVDSLKILGIPFFCRHSAVGWPELLPGDEDVQNQLLVSNLGNWDFNYGLRDWKKRKVKG